jgi:hypothetical protein
VSVKTVSVYRSRVLEKLQMRSNAELMRYAIENRFVELASDVTPPTLVSVIVETRALLNVPQQPVADRDQIRKPQWLETYHRIELSQLTEECLV